MTRKGTQYLVPKMRRHSAELLRHSENLQRQSRSRFIKFIRTIDKDRKAIVFLLAMSSSISVFCLFFVIVYFLMVLCEECVSSSLMEMSIWLIYTGSTSNPSLLIIFHKNLQRTCVKMCVSMFRKVLRYIRALPI